MYQPTAEQSKEAIKQAIQSKNLYFLQVSLHSASNHGIAINTPLDNDGNACLHYAAAMGATEIAKFLLDNGADLAATNRLGQAAEAIAASKGHAHLASWLKQLRKEKQRSGYAHKQTVEKMQVALEELRSENRQLLQNERDLKQEIDELKKTDHQPFLMQLQERLDTQERLMAQQRQVVQEQFAAQEKLMAQEKLEKLKAQEELAVQGKRLALQAEAIKEQQIEIKRQQNEIKNLQESQAREKNEMQKELKGRTSFLTPDIQEMLLLKKEKMQKKEEAKRQQEAERKYQELREKQRQEEQRRKEQLSKQAALIAALLKGDLEEAKKQEGQGALLTEPDEKGMYPLVAAVYGLDLEAVKYIEGRLKAQEAQEQWPKVDAQKAIRELDCAMPTALRDGATYGDLGKWYGQHGEMPWCNGYDVKCLKLDGIDRWIKNEWENRRGGMIAILHHDKWRECLKAERKIPIKNYYTHDDKNKGEEIRNDILILTALVAPSRNVHDNVVKEIREQLEALRILVESKAAKQPGAAFKPF